MTAEEYFEQGKVLLEQEDYNEAVKAFQNALAQDSEFSPYWYELGQAYSGLKRFDIAVEAFQKVVELDPNSAIPWHTLGNTYIEWGENEKAAEAFQKAVEIDPLSHTSWYGLAEAYFNLKEYPSSLEAIQTAIKLEPQIASYWNGLGDSLRRMKQYQQAIEAYQQAIELNPNYPAPKSGLGNTYHELGQDYQSILMFKSALDLDPKHPPSLHGLGNTYLSLKEYKKAEEAYKKVIQISPDLAEPWHGLGSVFSEQGKYQEAVQAFYQAIDLDDKYAFAWNGLGNLFRRTGYLNQAKEAYRNALNIDSTLAYSWNGLGNVQWDLEEFDEAINSYQKAIEINEKPSVPWNGLGNVYQAKGEYEKAINAYEKSITLDETYAAPWHGIGDVYQKLEKYEDAVTSYWKAIELDEAIGYHWHGLGLAYLRGFRDTEKTTRCFIRADYLAPGLFAYTLIGFFNINSKNPFFSYRIIQSYLLPEHYRRWVKYIQTTLENATPLKAYITWQSFQAEWGGLPEKKWQLWLGVIHYFMGAPSVALQYLNQSQAKRSELSLMAAYYQIQACYDFYEPNERYLQPALKQAETFLEPKPSFWKRLLSDTSQLDTEGILQCYYAGQIFVFNQEMKKALICFERVERNYLPAAYMALQMCHELKYHKRKEQKVKALVKREARQQQFTKGLFLTELSLDDLQFWKPFFHVAQYFELTEAIAIFHSAVSRIKGKKHLYIQNPKVQKHFHQLWKIRPEDWGRINARILEELNYRTFDKLFEEDLQPKVKTAPKLTEEMIEQRLDQYEDSELRTAFEHLRTMAAKGKTELGLGELIKAGQFEPEQYQLLNAYFFSNGQLDDYERVLLDFYILLQAEMKQGKPSKAQLAGVKKGADAVITDSLSYAIGFGTSLMVPGLPAAVTAVGGVLGGYAIKMGAGALTELFMGFIQKEEPTFDSYADFKERFEGYIGEQRRVLGEEGFYERYPVNRLYSAPGPIQKSN